MTKPWNITAIRRPASSAVVATKPLTNQRDPALAYSPGVVAALSQVIAADPAKGLRATRARGNLVAVITNGTAVLGLGDIGAARRRSR